VRSFVTGTVVSIDERGPELPAELTLNQNHPNPFNPSTIVSFGLPEAGVIRVAVYDILGREVAVLAEGSFAAGWHQVRFDATGLATGMYLYRIQSGGAVITKRMVLLK
jgi:hypothetical protein